MKSWLFLAFLTALLSFTQADTKILREVKISGEGSYRQETFSLNNENTPEEELVIKGTHHQDIFPKDDNNFVYRIETIYTADKDGYRVKYKLVREPYVQIALQLNPLTLKSAAG